MIKCNIDKKTKRGRVKAKGTAADFTLEICCLIRDVYQNLNKASPDAAQGFKHALIGMLLDPDSPVWKEEA